MGAKKRYDYSPVEEIFFPKKAENSQYDETIDEKVNEKLPMSVIKDNLLKPQKSIDICLKDKEKYLNTKSTNSIQNYFFFYEYRKCIFNLDGQIYIHNNPVQIINNEHNEPQRDSRLNKALELEPQNYNTFIQAYNI